MSRQRIESLDDPRVAPYRHLKDRELAREGGLFIAEGEHVVRRLLESDFPVESVFLTRKRADEIAPIVPAAVPVYVAAHELMNRVIGFRFHSGVIACGRRKPSPAIDEVMQQAGDTGTLVILPETANAENMGALIRIAAAFGADAMLLGERSCDPLWRQSIRVSMGTVFRLPIVRCVDLRADLLRLKQQWAVELIASVTDPDAEDLATLRPGGRRGLLFGNEAQGLERHWLDLCGRRVTIPMQLGTDSLNVAIAAAVFLYHFTKSELDIR